MKPFEKFERDVSRFTFHVSRCEGFASLVLIILVFTVSLFVITFLVLSALSDRSRLQESLHSLKSAATAESGLEDILYRVKTAKNYNPVETLSLNGGSATVETAGAGGNVSVTSTGNASGRVRRLAARLYKNTSDVEFHYGVQVGDGGLVMENNSKIIGNVYSNGSIAGAQGTEITGDTWVAGGTQPTPNMLWTVTTADFSFGRRVGGDDRLDIAQSFQTSTSAPINEVSLYLKKAGNPTNVTVQINKNNGSEPGKTAGDVLASGVLAANLVTGNYRWVDVTFSSAPILTASTTYWLLLDAARDDTNYLIIGIDGGNGYPYGVGKWSPNWGAGNPVWNAAGGDFDFKIWMGGVETKIDSMDIGGEAHAHRIEDTSVSSNAFSVIFINSEADGNVSTDLLQDCTSPIGGDALYNTIVNCAVQGATTTPATPPADPPPQNMPVSDGQIEQWKLDAAAGGTRSGDFAPDSSTSIGPKVINGNLILTANNVTLTLTGTVYVKGYVSISNGSRVRLDSSYGSLSGVLLADAWIKVQNNGFFEGSGEGGSYVMLLSLSPCRGAAAANCTDHYAAVDLLNNADGAIFYAPDGLVYLHNGVGATELTAYKIQLNQTATITYQQGLASAQFSAGPGASWVIQSWKEVP